MVGKVLEQKPEDLGANHQAVILQKSAFGLSEPQRLHLKDGYANTQTKQGCCGNEMR